MVQELNSLGVRLYDDDGTARSVYAVIEDLVRIWEGSTESSREDISAAFATIDCHDSGMDDSSIDDRSIEEFMEALAELMSSE